MRKIVLGFGLLVVVCVLVFAGPSGPARAGAGAAGDAAVLIEADRAFDSAFAARGIDGFAAFLSDEIFAIRPDQPIVRDKETFLEGWKRSNAVAGQSLRWQPQLARISDDGTLGFTVGTYTTTRNENGAARVVGSGKYVTIWRKQSNGSWKVIFDSGVQDTPPATPKPGSF